VKKLQAIGFWFNERAPSAYPRPQLLVGNWPRSQRTRVLAYLRAGRVFESYRARSFCRFACGERAMGHRDLSDGVYLWPEGLAHYVEVHAVTLPPHFVQHALADRAILDVEWTRREGLVDDTAWLAWARHASLDLTGWETPARALREHLVAELRAAKRPRTEILLVHPKTREVAVRLHSGALAITTLIPPFAMRTLTWDDWPRLATRRR
jgi:hypothetical protein